MNTQRRRIVGALALAFALAPVATAVAATTVAATTVAATTSYPSRAITILVGFAPGGGTDLIARQIVGRMAELLKQPVVVENRAGASGAIAAGAVAKAKPDGYTLLLGHVSSNAMLPAVNPDVSYAPDKDFRAITLIGSVPQVVVVPARSPARTLAEFIALAKSRPGQLNYASSGLGTQQHFAAELFQQATGTRMVHVPYKGSGAALADLMAGLVDVNFDTVPTVQQPIRAGTLRALAVTTRERVAGLPDVPTVIEAGVPDYEIGAWYMLMGPAALPPDITATLAKAVNETIRTPEVATKLLGLGVETAGGTPEAAQRYLDSEIARWKALAIDKGLRAR